MPVVRPRAAVDHVDLQVSTGQIHALVGLNGAGKTTLMRLLLDMLRPDQGAVTIFGRPVATAGSDLWRRVGHMLDTAFGYPELTVAENLRCAALLHRLPEAAVRKAVHTGIPISASATGPTARPGRCRLGTGNDWAGLRSARRTGTAGAGRTVHRPRPRRSRSGPNPLRAAAARGSAVLVSSHHLDEMARIADHISVMHRGRIVGTLDPTGVDLERTFFELVLTVDEADHDRRVE